MPLNDAAIRSAKAREKAYKLFDGGGLFLLVTPAGGKLWRLKYRFAGKEKLLALGTYPDITLAGYKNEETGRWYDGARDRREAARRLIAQGVDPGAVKQAEKEAERAASSATVKAIALEWHGLRARNAIGRHPWTPATAAGKLARLERDVFPALGDRPIAEVTHKDLEDVLRVITKRGANEIARRVKLMLEQIFRYASRKGGPIDRNPATDLGDIVAPPNPTHHAAITDPKEVGALLRAIRGYKGEPVTAAALRLAPLVFVRPGELRAAEWAEFDLDEATWRIPAARMKMKSGHVVPLARQAVEILRALHQLTGRGRLVFPSVRSRERPMSENTLNAALRRLGYTTHEQRAHGFRTMASTLLNEQGWHHDAIERQLAHVEQNAVRAAYNRAEHLQERRQMMQAWADYLDSLAAGGTVIPINRRAV